MTRPCRTGRTRRQTCAGNTDASATPTAHNPHASHCRRRASCRRRAEHAAPFAVGVATRIKHQHASHNRARLDVIAQQYQYALRRRSSTNGDQPQHAEHTSSLAKLFVSKFSLASTISEMFDGSDQLPLGPHANRVLVHRLVDDRERHKRGQFDTLQTDADLGGALADHADVRRSGDDFVDAVCALYGVFVGVEVDRRQPGDGRQLVSMKLITKDKSGARSRRSKPVAPRTPGGSATGPARSAAI